MEVLKAPGPHGPKVYRFKVDSQQFESIDQIISGLKLRKLAGLNADTELYVDVPHGWQDHFVSCDDQVDLGKPGIEKFITLRKKTVIFVNGTPHDYKKEKVSYEKIVELAHVPAQAATGYIVKYSNGPRQNPSGLMSPGTEVYVRNKMDFNVRSTHQS
jgi:hypothetical protein